MGVIAKGILRGYQGLFTPVSLGYPLSVFNKNSTLKAVLHGFEHSCSAKGRRKSWSRRHRHTMRMQKEAKLAAGAHRGHKKQVSVLICGR